MKKIIPLALIIIIIGISVYSYISPDRKPVEEVTTDTEEEKQYGDILIAENPRDISVFKLEHRKKLLNYLDPSEMVNYEDLVTFYITYLLKTLTDNPSEFYELNEKGIGHYLGIYEYDDYLALNQYLIKSGIKKDSLVEKVELTELEKEGNLLKSTIDIKFNDGIVKLNHYINYVYINHMNYLFLYSSSMFEG